MGDETRTGKGGPPAPPPGTAPADTGALPEDLQFAEEQATPMDNLRRASKDRTTRRFFAVVLIAAAGASAGFYYYTHIFSAQRGSGGASGEPGEPEAEVHIDRPVTVPTEKYSAMEPPQNPLAADLVREHERTLQAKALSEGATYVAPPPLWQTQGQTQADPLADPKPAFESNATAQLPTNKPPGQADERRTEKERFAQQLISAWSTSEDLVVVSSATPSPSAPPMPPPSTRSPSETGQMLHLPAGAKFYATISGAVNSYMPGPVRAVIEGGPLKGSVLLGTIKALPNERLILAFNKLSMGNQTYSINAIALDSVDGLPAVSGEVDQHYLRRYILPLAINLLMGYGQSFRYGTDIAVTGSGVVVGNQDVQERDRWMNALGQAGLSMLPALSQGDYSKYAEVKLHDGQGIGVMLLEAI